MSKIEDIVAIDEDGSAYVPKDVESAVKVPVAQKRLLSWLFSKKIPPVPAGDEIQENPQRVEHFFSYLVFAWLHPLFSTGYKRTIEENDVWELRADQTVEYHTSVFDQVLAERISRWRAKNPTKDPDSWPLSVLMISFMIPVKVRSLASLACSFICEFGNVCTPIISKKLILFVERRTEDKSISLGPGVGYALATGIMSLVISFAFNHMFDLAMKVGIDIKSVLIKKCFQKSMAFSNKSRDEFPVSRITSLIGNDLTRFEFAFSFIMLLIPMIFGTITVIGLLISNIGVAALAGIAVTILVVAIEAVSAKKLYSYRNRVNKYTDSRVAYVREMLNNFKIIKFYSWENPYFQQVKKVRDSEVDIVFKMKLVRCGIEASSFSLAFFSTMVSFVLLYKTRGIDDVAALFTSLSFFNLLAGEISFLPLVLSSAADAYSGLQRAHKVLQSEENQSDESRKIFANEDNDILALEIKDADFIWETFDDEDFKEEEKKQKMTKQEEAYELQTQLSNTMNSLVPIESLLQDSFVGLHDINLTVEKGEFIIITGLIGSGKTSLLSAIAGLMKRLSGEIDIYGSMVFCGFPWVQNATIKENILFGLQEDPDRFQRVLAACSLNTDLQSFAGGHMTEVGERGITLSGGQKARINLARAVYADRDIILLDDVLSAVDSKVGKHIMDHCFLDLLKDKTRILATHQLSLINAADRVIFLNSDGTIDIGTSEELKRRNDAFCNLLSFNAEADKAVEKTELDIIEEADDSEKSKLVQITEEEQKAVNGLSWRIYQAFFFAGKNWTRYLPAIGFSVSIGITVFLQQFTSVWLSYWTENKFESLSQNAYLGLYIGFNILCGIMALIFLIMLSWIVNNASKNLVIEALEKLLRAPMSFMDTTPMGRVLNRFTKDTDVLDNEIYQSLLVLIACVCQILGAIVLSVVYLPWIAIALPVLVFICICISDYTQSTARELKRIEAVRRSFIFNNINETLSGITTIRAYGCEQRFFTKVDEHINKTNAAEYLNTSTQRCLSIYLTCCSAIYAFLVSILAATGVFRLSAASTGVVLSSLLTFSDLLTTIFRQWLLVENSMNSAERLYQYAAELEQEAPFEVSEFKPAPNWPVSPSIEFQNVWMSYRPGLPSVLKGVDFKVDATMKIGICGRTGAGKSSIMSALYRMSEISDGKIIIDGLDIKKMGLADLRSKLCIIPQDTVLFKGTIRSNLDPFGSNSDEHLWEALRKSGLFVESKNSSPTQKLQKFHLDATVEDEGTNFSLGEKQLIALARALVRDSNILILDEATSSVDYETDSKIQQTIKNEFNHCTILCIAHRLKTILDYDKILVLDAGKVKEFDTPQNLYANEAGIFRGMCESSSITEADFAS